MSQVQKASLPYKHRSLPSLPRCMHCIQCRLDRRKLSVSLCDLWQNERKLCAHSYDTWKIIYPSLVTRIMVGGATASPWNFGSSWPCWSENADFQLIVTSSTSAVTPSKKRQLTLIGSPLWWAYLSTQTSAKCASSHYFNWDYLQHGIIAKLTRCTAVECISDYATLLTVESNYERSRLSLQIYYVFCGTIVLYVI